MGNANNTIKTKKNVKHRVSIPNADDKLRNICMNAAKKKYGEPLPALVCERLEKELDAIKSNNHSSEYLIGEIIVKKSLEEGYPVTTRGMIGSSLVANLCGITAVNPLPAHYYCPKCHHFETVNEERNYKVMGYDLPEKNCPKCGEVMLSEGADIEPELLMGIHLDKEPDITLNVASEVRPKLVNFIKESFGDDRIIRAGIKVTLEDGSIRRNEHVGGIYILPEDFDISEITELREYIPDDDFQLPVTECDYHDLFDVLKKYDLLNLDEISLLAHLEKVTGASASEIKTNDKNVLKTIQELGFSFLPRRVLNIDESKNLEDELIKYIKPKTFSDLIRINAMMHGTCVWSNNYEQLIEKGILLKDSISTRDDIMQELIRFGFTRERAYEIMNHVRKGKGVTDEMKIEMQAAGIPDWYIESCNKIVYIFPKSHTVEYGLLYWKLAYYKTYFPENYYVILKK